MLYFREALRRLHDAFQALIVEFVGRRPSRPSAEHRSHGNYIIFFRHILMNGVVGEPGERALAAIEKNFQLIST